MPATSNSVAAFSTTCSITIGIESHENFVTFEGKGIVGITKTINVSLPFLSYFGEKIKKWWALQFFNPSSLFLCIPNKRKVQSLPSFSLLSLFLISLQPNTV
jgi:hypothetical protein